jgi:hypothetical protein
VISRSLQDEIRGQTLAALMMLPRSSTGIVYSKLAGAMLAWLPAALIAIVVTLLSEDMRQAVESSLRPQNGSGMILLAIILYFALIPHFAGVFSLYVRWGAVALAICATIAIYFLFIMGFSIVLMILSPVWGAGFSGVDETLLFGFFAIMFCSICVCCHFWILLRVPAVAAR